MTIARPFLLAFFLLLLGCGQSERDLSAATITQLHAQLQRGDLTAEELTTWYIDRAAEIDQSGPALNSIIEINPDALNIARALDAEWRESGPRSVLHGIPVLLKANIDTADKMATSAGSLALAQHVAPQDAFIVERLRAAGAIILGKTNLSEWANFRSTNSSSGWSSVGGQTVNPYDTARSPCGSSSGSAVAVAASLASVAIGTETDGSVICPSSINGIVGIKPTVGLVSRSGIIPIAHSQDTAGPMARTVRDAALLLAAMAGIDSADLATSAAKIESDYAANLSADGLRGKRIGVIRGYFGAGSDDRVDDIFEGSVTALIDAGAIVIDDLDIEDGEMSKFEYDVLLYEFRADLNHYLKTSAAPVSSLADLITYNDAHASTVMSIFGQEIFRLANDKGPLTEPEYLDALAKSRQIARAGIDGLLEKHDLDALFAPSNGPAWMIDHVNGDTFSIGSSSFAAISGYPNITVPAGYVSGLPIGISFFSSAWSEKQLIEMAYAFEQATKMRQPPRF